MLIDECFVSSSLFHFTALLMHVFFYASALFCLHFLVARVDLKRDRAAAELQL